jgi:hypothetical protein
MNTGGFPAGVRAPVGHGRWRRLRLTVPAICPVQPPAALPVQPPVCVVCRGPVRPGCVRCYQCGRHARLAWGLLADLVVPISYVVKRTALAVDLWRYKSWPAPSARAQASLLALLVAFLHDHADCLWPPGEIPAPGRLAVVPTGCGRPGPHPLLELAGPYLRLPLTPLVIRPGCQGRELDVNRFRADPTAVEGGSVLLLEDSWVSGASAQSAVAALKLAGAKHVVVVVLGRHLDPERRWPHRRQQPRKRPIPQALSWDRDR